MQERKLIKTDRNGTKHYEVVKTCPKCQGFGRIGKFMQYHGGVCYDCNGTGLLKWTEKEYTPEYKEKLDAKAKRKRARAEAERDAEWEQTGRTEALSKLGFNAKGKTYKVLGNTFPIKDALKDAGARFNRLLGWHFTEDTDAYETIELDVKDLYTEDHRRFTEKADAGTSIDARLPKPEGPVSEWQGKVGERITRTLKMTRYFGFDTQYSYYGEVQYIAILEDEDGNQYKWSTQHLWLEENKFVTVKGTVKDHSEYKGVKQTVLTRVKEITE